MSKRVLLMLTLTLLLGASLYAAAMNVLATGNGTTATFTAVGAATVWEAVDDPIGSCDGDTSYGVLVAANSNHYFTFAAPGIPGGATIDSVDVVACNDAIGSTWTHTAALRVGGANFTGTPTGTVFTGGGYASRTVTWTTNPATTATWTLAEVNGVAGSNNLEEFGVVVTSNTTAGDEARVSQVYMVINYTGGGGGSVLRTQTVLGVGP